MMRKVVIVLAVLLVVAALFLPSVFNTTLLAIGPPASNNTVPGPACAPDAANIIQYLLYLLFGC